MEVPKKMDPTNNSSKFVDLSQDDDDDEEEDNFVDLSQDMEEDPSSDDEEEDNEPFFHVVKEGPPVAQQRPRKYGNHWVNPSKRAQKEFSDLALTQTQWLRGGIPFPRNVPVNVAIHFSTRRPNIHFKNGVRDPHMIHDWAKDLSPQGRGDIDNLTKFVLDALQGVAYVDDKQVMRTVVEKKYDNRGQCGGRTEVWVNGYNPSWNHQPFGDLPEHWW